MRFLIDTKELGDYVLMNGGFLLDNYAKIVESDCEGFSICITNDIDYGYSVVLFDGTEVHESWSDICDLKELMDCFQEAMALLEEIETEADGNTIPASEVDDAICEMLRELNISKDFWDDITNDIITILSLYGCEIK